MYPNHQNHFKAFGNKPNSTYSGTKAKNFSPWIPIDKLLDWAEEEGIFFKEFWTHRKHTPRQALESFVQWALQAQVQFGTDDDGEVHLRFPKDTLEEDPESF